MISMRDLASVHSRIERLESDNKAAVGEVKRLTDALEQAQKHYQDAHSEVGILNDEAREMRERIEQLEAALRTLCTCAELGPMTLCLACKVLESTGDSGNE